MYVVCCDSQNQENVIFNSFLGENTNRGSFNLMFQDFLNLFCHDYDDVIDASIGFMCSFVQLFK